MCAPHARLGTVASAPRAHAEEECMMLRMKERVTISVDQEALEGARAEVEAGRAPNLSAAVERSLVGEKKRQAIREAVALWEEEHGPIGEEAREWARRELLKAWGEISSSTQGR